MAQHAGAGAGTVVQEQSVPVFLRRKVVPRALLDHAGTFIAEASKGHQRLMSFTQPHQAHMSHGRNSFFESCSP